MTELSEHAARRLARLEAIAGAVRLSGRALGLLALGSTAEPARMDAWSDLDFFVIAKPGAKRALVEDLGWLGEAHPLAFAFRNTGDGWKALFRDGLFAEFAVFEPQELRAIPFAAGKLVWHDSALDPALAEPPPPPPPSAFDADWQVGEALTNLLVGLGRWRRGERASAFRFIQVYAVDRVIALASAETSGEGADPFSPERRVETRLPALAPDLPAMMPGVERCPEAARAILDWIGRRHAVAPALSAAILELCAPEA
ncbi:MAG TPA: hypothetical protein VED40_16395 [Azospirillaceae bacterium]|nr:hypothetical protein [Azospirillaceae bacterium]